MDMMKLHNHIRCQTRPFPGAFSYLEGQEEKYYFWRGAVFDSHITYPDARPGMVVEVFYDASFLVAVWDGTLRIFDYTSPNGRQPEVGQKFVDEC
jgi:formyl transferase-like protein